MGLPINTPDKYQVAEQVVQLLQNLSKKATKALSMENRDLINLHYTAIRTGGKFSAWDDEGLTVDVLGPYIGTKLDIEWEEHKQVFLDLQTTDLPALIIATTTYANELAAQTLGAGNLEYISISQSTKDILTPLITNIINLFES